MGRRQPIWVLWQESAWQVPLMEAWQGTVTGGFGLLPTDLNVFIAVECYAVQICRNVFSALLLLKVWIVSSLGLL